MAEFAKLIGEVRGIDFAPIKFEIEEDLGHWSVEMPGKVIAKDEAQWSNDSSWQTSSDY